MDDIIRTFFLSAIPVAEWRVSVPISLLVFEHGVVLTFITVLLGTMLPVVAILYLAEPILSVIKKFFPKLHSFIWKILEAIRSKKSRYFEKLEHGAPVFLAALPVPIIGGAYTAALAAFLFGIEKKKAVMLILIGSSIGIGFMIFLTLSGRAVAT